MSHWTKETIIQERNRLAPFHHNIQLPFGLTTYIPGKAKRTIEKTRVSNLVKHAFPALLKEFDGTLEGKRILDVACNSGGFSIEAIKHGAKEVLGIDNTEHYIAQANFCKDVLEISNIDFKVMEIDELNKKNVGYFDITFAFGILYHLENPINSMRKVADITADTLLLDTNVIVPAEFQVSTSGSPLWLMNMPPVSNELNKYSTTSLWRKRKFVQFTPNEKAVVDLLHFLGFSKVTKILPTQKDLETRYYDGKRVSFLARR
jgi:tRNA (mo5U34)-methyltransferase